MNPIINTAMMSVGGREFLLADVIKSAANIGQAMITGRMSRPNDHFPVTKLVFVGDEPIVSITARGSEEVHSDKLIAQVGTAKDCDDNVKSRLSVASDNFFTYGQSISHSLQPVLELLMPGLYCCYEAKMIPTDGTGAYFWNAYTQRREVKGTADVGAVIGRESSFIPAFLVPSTTLADFDEPKVRAQLDKIKQGKRVGGVALHLTGMFSLLLDGHHSSMACMLTDNDFGCLVIEPIRQTLTEHEDIAMEARRIPRVIALSCPYAKIPVEEVPPSMLESFLHHRVMEKPVNYLTLKSKSNKVLRNQSKKIIPKEVHDKALLLPTIAMIESAHAVTGLSDEQLDALLAGEVKLNDEVIITNNFYNSIITACNYLQYADFDRFLTFALDILRNRNLTATHKFVTERLFNINHERIYQYYLDIVDAGVEGGYSDALMPAELYVRRYETMLQEQEREREKQEKLLRRVAPRRAGTNAIVSQMESVVSRTRGK